MKYFVVCPVSVPRDAADLITKVMLTVFKILSRSVIRLLQGQKLENITKIWEP
jgi:hypothetical protein